MKTILRFYLLFRILLFLFCAIIFLPIGVVFRDKYCLGLFSGMHNFIDEAERTELFDKEDCDELRKNLDG